MARSLSNRVGVGSPSLDAGGGISGKEKLSSFNSDDWMVLMGWVYFLLIMFVRCSIGILRGLSEFFRIKVEIWERRIIRCVAD